MPETITGKDYSLVERTVLDGLGKFLDTAPGTPPVGTFVTEATLLNWIKGKTIVPGYLYQGAWYADSLHTTEITGEAGSLYVELDTNVLYRWDGEDFVEMSDAQLRADILDGTITAKKAECAASGNVITTTYAKQASLDALDHRVSNLEVQAGDQLNVDYPSATYGHHGIPANVAPYGKWTKARGVSRVENQLMTDWDFSSNVWVGNGSRTSISISDNVATITHTSDPIETYDCGVLATHYPLKVVTGHLYLVAYNYKASKNSEATAYIDSIGYFSGMSVSANTKVQYAAIKTATSDRSDVAIILLPSNARVFSTGDTEEYSNVIIRDLSVYFGGTIPSDADTIAKIQQNYPELLVPSDYGTSMVDSVVSGERAVGVNLWDEEWEEGALSSDGSVVASGFSNRRTTSFIRIDPSTAYFQTSPAGAYGGRIAFYDYNKNLVLFDNNGIPTTGLYTAPQGANYMRVTLGASYGTTYNHDIQFCLYSLPSEIRTVYHPYMESTLMLPAPVTLKSAGSVADTCEPNVEVEGVARRRDTQNAATVDLETLAWTVVTGTLYSATLAGVKGASSSDVVGDMTCEKYIPSYSSYLSQRAGMIAVSDNEIRVNTGSASTPSGLLTYALKEPVVTLSDPVLDPFIEVEGGGSIDLIQTQTPKVDSAFSMEYTVA